MWRILAGLLLIMAGAVGAFWGVLFAMMAGFAEEPRRIETVRGLGIFVAVAGCGGIIAGVVILWRGRRRASDPPA